jgi:hypothetical protein
MDVTIDEIQIVEGKNCFVLFNLLSGALINCHKDTGFINYTDSARNVMQNATSSIEINSEVFHFTKERQTISLNDGRLIAYLCTRDIQEIAEKTFYEDGQLRIYDFINQKFTIEF